MRLTESRLRRIIRDVIAESMSNPDTAEDVEQYLQDFRADQEATRLHRQRMSQLDADVDRRQKIASIVEILNTMSDDELLRRISMLDIAKNHELLTVIATLAVDQNKQSEVVSGGI